MAAKAVSELPVAPARVRVGLTRGATNPKLGVGVGRRPAEGARNDADVIVVGAGPAGSSAAYWLATCGLDVLVLEKSLFPREKVCGDGLTPRGARALVDLGIDVGEDAGWVHTRGVRIVVGNRHLEVDWPELTSFPGFGLVRKRADLDLQLVEHAVTAGARLHQETKVTALVQDQQGRVVGVTARAHGAVEVRYRAPLVLACDGASGRLAIGLGLHRNQRRPVGVAVRRYYRSPRSQDEYLEAWLLSQGRCRAHVPAALPGYGWIFGLGDGSVNVGLGSMDARRSAPGAGLPELLRTWLGDLPVEWGLREENALSSIDGAGLPMGFSRTPHYTRGLLLAGDAGGMVNPFTGEGIAYAMESGKLAAEVVVQALARPQGPARERALAAYPAAVAAAWGGHFRLGVLFAKLLAAPGVIPMGASHALRHPALMGFLVKLLVDLTEPHDGHADDRVVNALTALAPVLR